MAGSFQYCLDVTTRDDDSVNPTTAQERVVQTASREWAGVMDQDIVAMGVPLPFGNVAQPVMREVFIRILVPTGGTTGEFTVTALYRDASSSIIMRPMVAPGVPFRALFGPLFTDVPTLNKQLAGIIITQISATTLAKCRVAWSAESP